MGKGNEMETKLRVMDAQTMTQQSSPLPVEALACDVSQTTLLKTTVTRVSKGARPCLLYRTHALHIDLSTPKRHNHHHTLTVTTEYFFKKHLEE